MRSNARSRHSIKSYRNGVLILAISWIAGLLLGMYCAGRTGDIIVSMMLTACHSRMSIVWFVTATVLPFLITALAVFLSAHWIIFFLAFLKIFSYSFCAVLVWTVFGSAGWMIQLLLLFGAHCSNPLYYWLWNRCLSCQGGRLYREQLLCGMILLLVAVLDYCCVSPFLASLYIN